MSVNINDKLSSLGLEVVIWLETHITVTATKSKLFCACANDTWHTANSDVCPICTWQMGVLPSVNKKVIDHATKLSKAVDGEISQVLAFDRKHYSYPDLPKGYQLTQYRHPISKGGTVKFVRKDGSEWIVEISHFHIEEDPAKLTHIKGKTLIDYNRSGKPLFEVVTAPVIHSIEDAILYMEQLQKIVRYLGISDADMEKWHFKSDISISLRTHGDTSLNPRTEIKNLNSFKFALQALQQEVLQQIQHWQKYDGPQQEQQTKGWNEAKQSLDVMRKKENIEDYKFMEEPDIPPVNVSEMIASNYVDIDILPFAVERKLIDAGLSYEETIFFSSNIDKILVLIDLAEAHDLFDTAKVLLNLPSSNRYDGTFEKDLVKDVFSLYHTNENFDPVLLKTVFETLNADTQFDYRTFVRENTELTSELTDKINAFIQEKKLTGKTSGQIIGQLVKWDAIPKNFSRSAVLSYLQQQSGEEVQKGKGKWTKGKGQTSHEKKYTYEHEKFLDTYRTHHFSQISEEIEGEQIVVTWWIQSVRDHGDLIFIDLRCEGEVLQIQIDRKSPIDIDEITRRGMESVISVKGILIHRSPDDYNPHVRLGKVEVKAESINLLSGAQLTPFEIPKSHHVNEQIRMTYRYLDLRNPRVADNIIKRHQVTQYIRNYFDNNGFVHVDTPILGKPSDEGSREFYVPSRLHPHTFYTLPQAPQQLKQLLMGSGIDKYYQVARCFRDEDPKWDRQPEFTQVDLEMAYVKEDDVVNLVSELILGMICDLYPQKRILTPQIPQYDYAYVMEHYSSDKPDMRYWLKMHTVTDIVAGSGFKVFADVVKAGGIVKCMRVEKWKDMFSKKYLDTVLREYVQQLGGGGLANFHVGGETNFVEEKLGKDVVKQIIEKVGAEEGDTLLFAADQEELVHSVLSQTRQKIAHDYLLFNQDDISLLWVRNFPMFELTEEKKWKFTHNPFSMPKVESLKDFMEMKNIPWIIAQQYDIVMNGSEIGGGSIRAHLPHLLKQTYAIMGYSEEETAKSVGHIIDAFQYGFPPHGWLALGLDRILMILQWHSTIREVIPFPKTGDGKDLLMKAPSAIGPDALKESHIKLDKEE